MKNFKHIVLLLLSLLFLFSCGDDSDNGLLPEPEIKTTLSVSTSSFNFPAEGGDSSIAITSNTTWKIKFATSDWCKPNIQVASGNATVVLIAEPNMLEEERTMQMTLTATGADDVVINISQAAKAPDPVEPEVVDSIAPDITGVESDAKTLAAKIYLGWNLGNSLEASGGESAWGNPKTTKEMIATVKEAGFNAVRIPCSWNQYLVDKTSNTIRDTWFDRVKEVVDYCVDNDMYAILDIHWDNGWMEENCTPEKQEEVNEKLAIMWKQIARYFRSYDEHLLFAGANEPNVDNQQQADVLAVYMQTFVDVVRATGGRNAYRNLIIQAPRTDIDKADDFMKMPNDITADRLMAEVHYYTPWQFCGLTKDEGWGKMFYFWGKDYHLSDATGRFPNWNCEEDFVKASFQKMKTKFVDQNIPVILGEYGAIRRIIPQDTTWQKKHDESRTYFLEFVTQEAKNFGLVPFYWDEGSLKENGFGIIDRKNNVVGDQQAMNGLLKGASAGNYPF